MNIEKTLNKDYILTALRHTIFSDVILLDEVDSTNEFAKRIISKNLKKDIVIIAESQTAGKGRKGRTWLSKKYKNILFSIILKSSLPKSYVFCINMALALSCISAIEKIFNIKSLIKWPNDIYVNNKKLAGILSEFFLKDGILDYLIIGLGINVNWSPESKDLIYPATSLFKETGKLIKREPLLIEILQNFDKNYKKILKHNTKELYKMWNEKSLIIGKHVSIYDQENKLKGIAVRIEEDGSLILLTKTGEKKVIYGDVSLR